MTLRADEVLAAVRRASASATHGSEIGPDSQRRLHLTPASQIRSERIRWLWKGRLPLRGISVVAGEKGLGKSTLTNAYLVAEATLGRLPGELEGHPTEVLICTAEDDWRSVVKPRLSAHGAELERVHQVEVRDADGQALLTLPNDVVLLEQEIQKLRSAGRQIGLVVIDPIGAFLSTGTDTHRDASVRRALAPLAAMADRLDVVVLVVAHLNKDDNARMLNRITGAGAFVNAARSVLVLARTPDDPEGEGGSERVLVQVGSNWGRSAVPLAARIESREVQLDDGSATDVGLFVVLGESELRVEDLQRGGGAVRSTEVEGAITVALDGGPRRAGEVKSEVAQTLGVSVRQVERVFGVMKKRNEVNAASKGFPKETSWSLVSNDSDPGAIATTPDAPVVATGQMPVAAGDDLVSSDSAELDVASGSPSEGVAS